MDNVFESQMENIASSLKDFTINLAKELSQEICDKHGLNEDDLNKTVEEFLEKKIEISIKLKIKDIKIKKDRDIGMCVRIMKTGGRKGQQCVKDRVKDSIFCSSHKKEDEIGHNRTFNKIKDNIWEYVEGGFFVMRNNENKNISFYNMIIIGEIDPENRKFREYFSEKAVNEIEYYELNVSNKSKTKFIKNNNDNEENLIE